MPHYRMDRDLLKSLILFLFLLAAAAFFLLKIDFSSQKRLEIQGVNGELALDFWYGEKPLSLEGEWFGFPDQLLLPNDVDASLANSVPVRFPDIWQPPKPRRHAMTYTLLLRDIPQGVPLAIKIPEVKNSFRLFVDDREVASGGVASERLNQHKAYFGDRIVNLGVLPENVRLTLHISNFGHSRGGVHGAPILATEAYWLDVYHFNILIECVVISLAFIAGLLILLEYYLVPEHKELLWIALFSLVLAGYIGSSGYGGLAVLVPDFSWQIAVRMEYIGFVAAIPLFINWLSALYKGDLPQRVIRWFAWAALMLTVFVLFTPSILFTSLLYPVLAFMCLCITFATWAMLLLLIRKRSGIRVLVLGALALMGGILHDLLVFLEVIHGKNLLGLGVLLFLVAQLGFLTFYRTQEQLRILDLNHSLNTAVHDLERCIEWRKGEEVSRSAEIALRSEKLEKLLYKDDLTGLLNRHYFLEVVERRLERMQGLSFSIIIININQYKVLVDQYGRFFSEQVLREAGEVISSWCGEHFDRISARYGGDEFIVWVGHCSADQANIFAQQICKGISALRLPVTAASSSEPDDYCRIKAVYGVASTSDLEAAAGEGDLSCILARASDNVHGRGDACSHSFEGVAK